MLGRFGGKTLYFAYFEHIPDYADIASAFHNVYRGCIDPKEGVMDRKDFSTMKKRIWHVNEITSKYIQQDKNTKRWKLKSGTLKAFSPVDEQKSVPDLRYDLIREYACGQYAMDLADPYVAFWQQLGSEIKFRKIKKSGGILLQATGLKSRYSPRVAREVYLLFKGSPLATTDTFCTCHVGARPVGGCAHAIAVLILIGQKIGNIQPREPTRSELMLHRGLVLFQEKNDSDDENESDQSDNESSEED